MRFHLLSAGNRAFCYTPPEIFMGRFPEAARAGGGGNARSQLDDITFPPKGKDRPRGRRKSFLQSPAGYAIIEPQSGPCRGDLRDPPVGARPQIREAIGMKTIIIYATKTGTVKRCAALLAARLGAENTDMFDIAGGEPDYAGYDTVVFGTPVRMGMIDGRIRRMIQKRAADLRGRRCAVFTCNCLLTKASDAFVRNFSEDFMEHALCMDTFGGEFDPQKQRGGDRLLLKIMELAAKSDPALKPHNHILPDNIANFAKEIARE